MIPKCTTLQKNIITKLQFTQWALERYVLGIIRSDLKKIKWIRKKTQLLDVIQRFLSLKWQMAKDIAKRTDNLRTTRIAVWYPKDIKNQEDVQTLDATMI